MLSVAFKLSLSSDSSRMSRDSAGPTVREKLRRDLKPRPIGPSEFQSLPKPADSCAAILTRIRFKLKLPLIGAYQAANVLAAAGLVLATAHLAPGTPRGAGATYGLSVGISADAPRPDGIHTFDRRWNVGPFDGAGS